MLSQAELTREYY